MKKRKFFDGIAPSWHEEHQNAEEELKLEALFRRIPMSPGQMVLDAGCGTGLLGRQVGAAHLLGVDGSLGMLRETAGRGAPVAQALLDALPFGDGTFDAALCFTALALGREDPAPAARELRRVVRPNGTVVITVLHRAAPCLRRVLAVAGLALRDEVDAGQDRAFLCGRT